jgi:UDP-glucuronate decarboxylase
MSTNTVNTVNTVNNKMSRNTVGTVISKHYLITGGAGFIGINLSIELLELGHRVSVVDNLFCSDKLHLPTGVKFYKNDINELTIKDIKKIENYGGKLNGIFNLACPYSCKSYEENPLFTITTCTSGILNILNFAHSLQIPILHASTSELQEYTSILNREGKYKRNIGFYKSRECYIEGKRIAETICREHKKTYDTNVRVVRIFNTYGPYMSLNDKKIIPTFFNKASRNEKLPIYENNTQQCNFCYVDDMVQGLITAINTNYEDIINLGNPQQYNISEIALFVLSIFDKDVNMIEYCRSPVVFSIKHTPDISRAREILKWNPETPFYQGLVKTKTHLF